MSDKTDRKKKGDEPPGYAAACSELETILEEIESGEIDLDVLAEKVERAAALLAVCREKLAATEIKVRKVVAELGEVAEDRGGDRRGAGAGTTGGSGTSGGGRDADDDE